MRINFRPHLPEIMALMLMTTGLFAIAHAQETATEPPQRTMKVEVEITENGKITKTIKEVNMDLDQLSNEVDEMMVEIESIIEHALGDGLNQELEIIVNQQKLGNHHGNRMHWSPEPKHHHMAHRGAFLGVVASDVAASDSDENSTTQRGLRIIKVVEGSAAEKAGLKLGDQLLSIDGVKLSTFDELRRQINLKDSAQVVRLEVISEGKEKTVEATLGKAPVHVYQSRVVSIREEDSKQLKETGLPVDKQFYHYNYQPSGGNESFKMKINIQSLSSEEVSALEKTSGQPLDQRNSLEPVEFRVSPNPTSGQLKVHLELVDRGNTEIKVFDQQGKVIFTQELHDFQGAYSNHINLEKESAGTFYISVQQNGRGKVSKVVKE